MCSIKLVFLTFPLWSCSPGLGQAAVWCWHPEHIPCSLSSSSAWWHLHSIGCSRAEALQRPGAAGHPDLSLCLSSLCPCAGLSHFSRHIPHEGRPTVSYDWFDPGHEKYELVFNFLMSESTSQPSWTAGCGSEMPFALQIGGIDHPQKHLYVLLSTFDSCRK